MQILFLSFFVAAYVEISHGADWCYQSQVVCQSNCKAPEKWTEANVNCGGSKQSPINIVTKRTIYDERLKPFKFTGYDHAFRPVLKNNGHTVKVSIDHEASVEGGNLVGTYKAVQFHLHWGKDGGPGSEHTVDGEQYPMELHIVHMKSSYANLNDALRDPSGVAVLGFFYEASTAVNRNYQSFVDALKNVADHQATHELPQPVSLQQLILSQHNLTNFYRYEGSLTTPDCSQAVVWTVFEHAIPLHKSQLSAFSRLKFSDGKSMVGSFRPVQPLNGRPVYRSSSTTVLSSVALLVSAAIVALHLSQPN